MKQEITTAKSKKNKKSDKKADPKDLNHITGSAQEVDTSNTEKRPIAQSLSDLQSTDKDDMKEQQQKNIDEQQCIETKVVQILRNKDGKTTQSEYKHAMTYLAKAFAIDYRFDTGTNYLTFACQLFPNSKPMVFKRVHLYDIERMDNLHSIHTTRLNAKGQGPSKLGMKEDAQTGVNKDRNHMMTMIKAKLNLTNNPTEWLPAMGLTKGVVIEILNGLGPIGKVAEPELLR